MKKIALSCLLLASFENSSFAQTSVIQDAKGETSLQICSLSVVTINAQDESISFSYGKLLPRTNIPSSVPLKTLHYVGLSAKGKGKNGVASLVKDGDFQYDGSLGGFFGIDFIDPSTLTKFGAWHFYSSFDLLFSQYKLFDSNKVYADQIYNENQFGYKLNIGLNQDHEFLKKIPYVFGVSINGGHKNNTETLTAMDIADYATVRNAATGNTRIVQSDKTSAYDINNYEKRLGYFNFNIDIGPQLGSRFLLLAHSRWTVREKSLPTWNPAMGLYLTKEGSPLEAVAGIQLQISDYFGYSSADKDLTKRTGLNLVAGFSF